MATEEGGGTGPRGLLGGWDRCWMCTLFGVEIMGFELCGVRML